MRNNCVPGWPLYAVAGSYVSGVMAIAASIIGAIYTGGALRAGVQPDIVLSAFSLLLGTFGAYIIVRCWDLTHKRVVK